MDKTELMNRAHDRELRERARNFDNHEWDVILSECPAELKLMSFKRDFMKLKDTAELHERVDQRIERIYADEEMMEWV